MPAQSVWPERTGHPGSRRSYYNIEELLQLNIEH